MVETLPVNENINVQQWIDICALDDILPNTGVCALVEDKQVAVFRVQVKNEDRVYALSNYDPFSKANVLSRGILGDRQGILKVASPIYKQNFNLVTGECLDNDEVKIPAYPTKVVEGRIQIGID